MFNAAWGGDLASMLADGESVAWLIGEQLGFDAMAWASSLTDRFVNFGFLDGL